MKQCFSPFFVFNQEYIERKDQKCEELNDSHQVSVVNQVYKEKERKKNDAKPANNVNEIYFTAILRVLFVRQFYV